MFTRAGIVASAEGVGVPAWVPEGARWSVDVENDRVWLGSGPSLSIAEALTAGRMTFARSGSALAHNAAGIWSSFATNVLRHTDAGMLVEPAATNHIRNPRMEGAAIGSFTTEAESLNFLPDNMRMAFSPTGLTGQMLGTGTEFGLAYADIRISGTAGSTGAINLRPEAQGFFTSLTDGMTLAAELLFRILEQPNPPTSYNFFLSPFDDGGNFSGNTDTYPADVETLPSGIQRFYAKTTVSKGSAYVGAIRGYTQMRFELTSGVAYDFTIRVYYFGWYQNLAQDNASPVLPAVGTPSASTRNADTLLLAPPADDYDIRVDYGGGVVSDLPDVIVPAEGWTYPNNLQGKTIKSITGWQAGSNVPSIVSSVADDQDVVIEGVTYRAQTVGEPHAITKYYGFDQDVFSFSIISGEHPDWDNPGVDRSEFSQQTSKPAYGVDIWQEWQFRVRDFDSTSTWFVIGQWHGTANDGRSPWFALEWLAGGGIKVIRRTAPSLGAGVTSVTAYTDTSLSMDVWHQVVVHQVASATGTMEVWIDGIKVVDYSGAPVGFMGDVDAGYFKFGGYRNNAPEDARIDYLQGPIGTASLADRIGNPIVVQDIP